MRALGVCLFVLLALWLVKSAADDRIVEDALLFQLELLNTGVPSIFTIPRTAIYSIVKTAPPVPGAFRPGGHSNSHSCR
jgi:hypothetical protein